MKRSTGHLWAIGYDDLAQANRAKEALSNLAYGPGMGGKYLLLSDLILVERQADGNFSFDREEFGKIANLLGCTAVGLLAGLVVGAPLTLTSLGAIAGGAGSVVSAASVGIDDDFIQAVQGQIKPGTCALFVLDEVGDIEVILNSIRGFGGTVLQTNVDVVRAKLIQTTLAATALGSKVAQQP